jgi:hypothetical protein
LINDLSRPSVVLMQNGSTVRIALTMIDLRRFIGNTPTLMVVVNLAVKSALMLLIAPAGVHLLPQKLGVTWTLAVSLVGLSTLFDLGISTIVSRHVTFAKIADQKRGLDDDAFNVLSVAKMVYRRVALLYAVLVVSIAGYMLIGVPQSQYHAGLGWALLITFFAGPLYLLLNYRYAFLMGSNRVAFVSAVQAASGFVALPVIYLFLRFGIYQGALVAIYAGLLVPAFVYGPRLPMLPAKRSKPDEITRKLITSDVYKAAFGVGTSAVIYNLASYYYGRHFLGVPGLLGALLLFQLMRGISAFSQAPFYATLPRINALYARKEIPAFLRVAFLRLFVVLGIQISCFTIFYFVAVKGSTKLLDYVPDSGPIFYWILATALVLERLAAMLLQIYTATGHVIWHRINGWSGFCQILLVIGLSAYAGLLSFPLALLCAILVVQLPLVIWHMKTHLSFRSARRIPSDA